MQIGNASASLYPSSSFYGSEIQHFNDKPRASSFYFRKKCAQMVLVRPFTAAVRFLYHTAKCLTWVALKTGVYVAAGYHTKSADYFESECYKTAKAVRDILVIPRNVKSTLQDIRISTHYETQFDTPLSRKPPFYLNVPEIEKFFQQFSGEIFDLQTFDVIRPVGIKEFPALNDPHLKTIMASHLFKPGVMAINFGCPNVATFVTKEGENGLVETEKVDAKSLCREPMHFHETHGKIQSGFFLVPSNLPSEALERFTQVARGMVNRKDITCVNTNCRVLKGAGFSIEGVRLDEVIWPNQLIEHLLFRHVFYTDATGHKHRVRFDIISTTLLNLQEFFEKVDTAVCATYLRHRRRNADTQEHKKVRGAAAARLIEEERQRLSQAQTSLQIDEQQLQRRKVTVSVPSFFGEIMAGLWGRHTIYELDLSDKQRKIKKIFQKLAAERNEPAQLSPFPQPTPSCSTRIKRDFFFSGLMILFLRRHMMGRVDALYMHAQDIFNSLKWTHSDARLNYVILGDKMVVAKVNASHVGRLSKVADWALSKHALLAARRGVYCSGEMWYDQNRTCFVMNCDSGTYLPSRSRVEVVVKLANTIFEVERVGIHFEAV